MSKQALADVLDDLIWGVEGTDGITAELNKSSSSKKFKSSDVYYLIAHGKPKLPIRKFGHRTIVASRKELAKYLAGELADDNNDAA